MYYSIWGGGGGGGGENHIVMHLTKCPSSTATFIQTPINATVCLGSTAQFMCSATDVTFITYLVDSMIISSVASRGVSVSAPTYSGNMIVLNLTILGIQDNNNSLIACKVIVSNGTALKSSAYLSIQGQHIYLCGH